MTAAPHPLAAAVILLVSALVAVGAFPTGLPAAEDQVAGGYPAFPGFPGFPGFWNPFYPQHPQLPLVPPLPQFPFFYPPIIPYNFLDKPSGGLDGGVSTYHLGGSSTSGSGTTSTGSVTTYGLQSHNGHLTGGGLIVAANPNGTFTTYEIILRPINVTASPTPVVSAPEVAPEAVADANKEVVAPSPAKEVVNMAAAAATPAAAAEAPAEVPAKTVRREVEEEAEAADRGASEAADEYEEYAEDAADAADDIQDEA